MLKMEQPIITTISKFAPEDISMDFERLRQEGIQHLEDLATYIWTDFNVHDPGITILEVLCYAITDLGYRANLPIEDILASNNGDSSFFTATEILPICPVTQNDYRKLLIDFPGVRNAWVECIRECGPIYYILDRFVADRTEANFTSFATKLRTAFKGYISAPPPNSGFLRNVLQKIENEIENGEDSNFNLVPDELEGLKVALEEISVEINKIPDTTSPGVTFIKDFNLQISKVANAITKAQKLDLLVNTPINDQIISDTLKLLKELEDQSNYYHTFLRYNRLDSFYYDQKLKNYTAEEIQSLSNKYSFSNANLKTKIQDKLKELVNDQKNIYASELMDLIYFSLVDANQVHIDDIIQTRFLVDEIVCGCNHYFDIITEAEWKTLSTVERNEYSEIKYKGLYQICIDPFQDIEPDSKAAKQLIERIKNGYIDESTEKKYPGLFESRNLGEDFCDIRVAPIQKINLCLDITVDDDADENEVMAQVIYRLQNFLTPSVPFHTFQQLLEKGRSCDEVFNGPLLCNGFIDDESLLNTNIPAKIQLSDLYKIILETPYVQTINSLKTRNEGAPSFGEEWCIDYDPNQGTNCPTKPIIALRNSMLCVQKNGIRSTVVENEIEDQIALLKLASRNLVGNANNEPVIPKGRFREDLADYVSTQFEFPHNYVIGDNGLPDEATPKKRAQVKQLQAYLLFFDRLLANYLLQLSKVRDLFSVHQDPKMATYFYQTLYEIPGIPQLINDVFEITADGIKQLMNHNLPEPFLAQLQRLIGTVYIGRSALETGMTDNPDDPEEDGFLSPASWALYREKIQSAFCRSFETEAEWEAYRATSDNYYIQQLRFITETPDKQFNRKHQLIDHLLARFGEQFTNYAANVFESRNLHLEAKADFLKNLPQLGLNRAKGYNYRAKDPVEGDPDVWNTNNVAGLKNRIYHLLGWGSASTESTLVDPNYLLVDEADRSNDLLPLRLLRLYERGEDGNRAKLLLTSTKSYSVRKIKDIKRQLQVLINNIDRDVYDYYNIKEDDEDQGQYRVVFEANLVVNGITEAITLQSIALSRTEADLFLEEVLSIVEASIKGGFHLIEHILLRPNDDRDDLLKMTFSCDLQLPPVDPYSFWVSVIAPAWKGDFKDPSYQAYFMQLVRRETPAHIALCFRWIDDEDKMENLEDALEQWREALANCTPDECDLTDKANVLIGLLNDIPCACYCFTPETNSPKC